MHLLLPSPFRPYPRDPRLDARLDALPAFVRAHVVDTWQRYERMNPAVQRVLLDGLLLCSPPAALSQVASTVATLLRIDFVAHLPPELVARILGFLDARSLTTASRASRTWHVACEDDRLWKRLCDQHIDQRCGSCGWGLPLLAGNARRASLSTTTSSTSSVPGTSALPMSSLAAADAHVSGQPTQLPAGTPAAMPTASEGAITHQSSDTTANLLSSYTSSATEGSMYPLALGTLSSGLFHSQPVPRPPFRKWKQVYAERMVVARNWRRGAYRLHELSGHTDGIMCLYFDDYFLATGSYDRTIRLWDISDPSQGMPCVRVFMGHTRAVRSLVFDSRKLISGSLDGTVRVWNIATGECVRVLEGHEGGVASVHFLVASSASLPSNSASSALNQHNQPQQKNTHNQMPPLYPTQISVTPLASGSEDTTIRIWNPADSSSVALRGHTDWVNSVRFVSSRILVSGSDDATIRVWDIATRSCLRVLHGHKAQVSSLAHHPSVPEILVSASLDSTLRIWNLAPIVTAVHHDAASEENAAPVASYARDVLFGHVDGVWDCDIDPLRIVSAGEDGTVKLWDWKMDRMPSAPANRGGGGPHGHNPHPASAITASDDETTNNGSVTHAFSHNRTNSSSSSGTATDATISSPPGNRCLHSLTAHGGAVNTVKLGDTRVVCGGEDGIVRVWDFGAA